MKQKYESPLVEVVDVEIESNLLAESISIDSALDPYIWNGSFKEFEIQ